MAYPLVTVVFYQFIAHRIRQVDAIDGVTLFLPLAFARILNSIVGNLDALLRVDLVKLVDQSDAYADTLPR